MKPLTRSAATSRQQAAVKTNEGCSCGNDVVYLSYCMECLHDLEVEAEQRGYKKGVQTRGSVQYKFGKLSVKCKMDGCNETPLICNSHLFQEVKKGAQAEREKWKKAIVQMKVGKLLPMQGGVVSINMEKLKEQGVSLDAMPK